MNTLLKIAILSGFLWIACIVGTIAWGNATIEGDDFTRKQLPSAAWGVPILGSLAFILFIVFIVTLIIGLKRKK